MNPISSSSIPGRNYPLHWNCRIVHSLLINQFLGQNRGSSCMLCFCLILPALILSDHSSAFDTVVEYIIMTQSSSSAQSLCMAFLSAARRSTCLDFSNGLRWNDHRFAFLHLFSHAVWWQYVIQWRWAIVIDGLLARGPNTETVSGGNQIQTPTIGVTRKAPSQVCCLCLTPIASW